MKALFKLFVAVPVVVLSALSCNNVTEPETATDTSRISISVLAEIDNLPACGDTKASIAPVMRLSWESGDDVFVYDGSDCLGTLTVSLQNKDARYAKLDGIIDSPKSEVLTCVYAGGITGNPVVAGNTVTFPMAEQNPNNTPFVVYGTMPYEGTAAISDKIVNFQFATSVVLVNCLNLATEGTVTKTELSGINTNCVLTLSGSDAPTVSGSVEGTITTATGTFSSGNGKLYYYVGVPVSGKVDSSRGLTVYQGDDNKYTTTFTTSAFAAGSFNNVLYSLAKVETGGGEEEYVVPEFGSDPNDCVQIGNLYWAKNNLAVTNSGKGAWKDAKGNEVKVPGTNYSAINGDYFQWGASYDGYGLTGEDMKPENLVIYRVIKSDYHFDYWGQIHEFSIVKSTNGSAPFRSGTTYAKYTKNDVLALNDDAAYLCLHDDNNIWRMPTSVEWSDMKDATYWAYDETDKGFYVFLPFGDYKAGSYANKMPADLDKSKAILFFPDAGYGSNQKITSVGTEANYLSSSLCSDSNPYIARIYSSGANAIYTSAPRYRGCSIRPVKSVSE